MKERSSGILMHISSLPNAYGIGTFGREAYEFIDFLELAGQKYWQILPLGPTGYGDSPYQSFSSFAGNPYFIDFEILEKEGLLYSAEYKDIDFGSYIDSVDYEKIFNYKLPILRLAFERGKNQYSLQIEEFQKENKDWLEDYAFYMAVKVYFDLRSWQEWDDDIKLRIPKAIKRYKEELREEIQFWIFLQYIFFKQWCDVKVYANEKGINIIGDIPIYVAEDSADTWANSELFVLDQNKCPLVVAGCPPDAFSKTGQLWGNPIYDWEALKKRNYDWWIKRIKASYKLYDLIRIDHFRGFESYWEIPYGDLTAEKGRWVKGPGIEIFHALKKELGELPIIAEDLGFLTEDVIQLRKDTGYPGMKVLQFAFDTKEESDYLPHHYDTNSVVYTGTHDNDTVKGWFKTADPAEVSHAIDYLKLQEEEGYHWGFIRGAWSSVSYLAIAQMQDFLGLGSEARMNTPSTLGCNWKWRVEKEELSPELAHKISQITKLYGR